MNPDNKPGVLIEGKVYEYREDHIYDVNGVRTYFVDNAEKAPTPPPIEEK